MSQQGQPKPEPEMNLFDAAKAIVEALNGLDKNVQSLAMRFAGEALGLQSTAALPTSVGSPHYEPLTEHDLTAIP